MRPRLALWLAPVLTLVVLALARADDAPRSVEVILLGGGSDTGTLVDTVRELLGRLGLVANVHAVNGDDDAAKIERGPSVARVRVDLRSKDETVLLIDGRGGDTVRRTVHRDQRPTVAREELAHAIQGAIEAQLFLDGDRPPPPPDAGPPLAPPPQPPAGLDEGPVAVTMPPAYDTAPLRPASKSALALDVTTLTGAGGFSSSSGPVVHFGGEVGLASRHRFGPFASVSFRALLPFEGETETVTAHASVASLRALGGVELARASWIGLSVAGGGGVDVLSVDARSRSLPQNVLQPATTRVDPILTLAVRLQFPIVSSVTFTVLLLGDVDLAGHDYVIERGTVDESVFSPWRVRPTALAGFTFTPFGRGAFSAAGERP